MLNEDELHLLPRVKLSVSSGSLNSLSASRGAALLPNPPHDLTYTACGVRPTGQHACTQLALSWHIAHLQGFASPEPDTGAGSQQQQERYCTGQASCRQSAKRSLAAL